MRSVEPADQKIKLVLPCYKYYSAYKLVNNK